MQFNTCGRDMTWSADSSISEGFRWWCHRRVAGVWCNQPASIKQGSWFQQGNLTLQDILLTCNLKSYGGQQQHPLGSSGSENHTVRRTNNQLHQTKYGTWLHVITPELVEGTHHPHITPMLWSILFYMTHLTHVWYGESRWSDSDHYQRAQYRSLCSIT
jgi:hypothetical protein